MAFSTFVAQKTVVVIDTIGTNLFCGFTADITQNFRQLSFPSRCGSSNFQGIFYRNCYPIEIALTCSRHRFSSNFSTGLGRSGGVSRPSAATWLCQLYFQAFSQGEGGSFEGLKGNGD